MLNSDTHTIIFTKEETDRFILNQYSYHEKQERKAIKKACKKNSISVQEYKVYRNMLLANVRN
jgi:hypothetical protein